MEAKTVKEVLQATEWILTNVGWCQGSVMRDKNGATDRPKEETASACLFGALQLVEAKPYALLYEAERLLQSIIGGWIISFNDEPGRTKDDVLNVVRKAIEKA